MAKRVAKLAILLFHHSFWLLVPGLSSHFFSIVSYKYFEVSNGWKYLWSKLQEPLTVLVSEETFSL